MAFNDGDGDLKRDRNAAAAWYRKAAAGGDQVAPLMLAQMGKASR